MEASLVSIGIVTLAEIGDKTQLLSILLITCFNKPVSITPDISISTLVNHVLIGAVGGRIMHVLSENVLRWILGVGSIIMTGWMLIPDRLDGGEALSTTQRGLDILGTIIVAFFFVEMGDETQIATVVLAAHFNDAFSVAVDTTVGIPLVNVPAVLMSNKFMSRTPIELVHRIAVLTFLVLSVLVLPGASK